MKRYNNFFFSCLFIFFSLTSCVSVKTLVIDVDKPAPITLPQSIHNITIVNNAVVQPEDFGHTESIMGRPQKSLISVKNDSVDYILMQTIGEGLSEKNFFNNVVLYEYPTRADTEYEKIIPLDKNKISDIAKQTDAGAVLTINKFLISTNSNTLPADDYRADIYNILDLQANITFNIYSDKGDELLPEVYETDSIYWVEARQNHTLLSEPIPSREIAMKTGAMILGNSVVKSLTPYKESQNRLLYSDVSEAGKYADNNDWDKARSLWIEGFNKEKKAKAKARIANNIALSYELSDNLKEALQWNQTSIDQFKEKIETSIDKNNLVSAELYKQILLQRVVDFKILDLIEKK